MIKGQIRSTEGLWKFNKYTSEKKICSIVLTNPGVKGYL
jgi:hypothetical protein